MAEKTAMNNQFTEPHQMHNLNSLIFQHILCCAIWASPGSGRTCIHWFFWQFCNRLS